VNTTREKGMALITALLVLLLVSSIIIGLSWMVMTNQRLGGNNANRQAAFYAAEAGMEKMTADLGAQYGATNALSTADITTVMGKAPVIPGVSYNATPRSYYIGYTPDPNNAGNPLAENHTILSGAYAGLQGLLTPFTLTVRADLADGSEAKLVRTVQTVGIPVFQFGIFSQVDLSYFPGPIFNFGGRVHTNGNLWLAAGSTLTLADKVTSAGQIVVQNLANGYATIWPGNSNTQTPPQTDACQSSFTSTLPSNPSSNPYPGTIMVAVVPEASCLQLEQGSVTGSVSIANVKTAPVNGNWYTLSTGTAPGDFAGNIQGGTTPTGAQAIAPLSLAIAAPAVGGTPIELIRRPVTGENSQLTAERYYTLSSVNILLDDSAALLTGTPNACGTPVELSTLAVDSRGGPYSSGFPSWYTGGPEGKLPLPTSGATSTSAYTYTDGYWVKQYNPIIMGYILVNLHNAAGACVDVTQEILNLGFIGRNLNPLSAAATTTITVNTVNTLSGMAASSAPSPLGATTCTTDPSANAVIRLARLRDNPSSVYGGKTPGGCGSAIPYGSSGYIASDYWPNVLYDTRESVIRDQAPPNPNASATIPFPNGALTAAGVMNYVELDVNNLTRWFTGAIGTSGKSAENVTGYAVYFSDRRGETSDPTAGHKTGAFGYNDNVNASDAANGCPNGVLDTGEDYAQTGALLNYANKPNPLNNDSGAYIGINGSVFPSGTFNVGTTAKPVLVSSAVLVANSADGTCSALTTNWPGAEYFQSVDARENPPLFFRRALKLVNGSTISIGTCDTVPCGLTIATENPVYIQGNYNCMPSSCGAGTYVTSGNAPASVVADSATLLSSQWNDVNSFAYPYTPGGRPGNTTTYRTAIAAGKGVEFVQIAGTAQDYGTDGGVHNFLRYLESWSGTLYYKGSIVSFYYNEQGIGVYKCCTTVYGPPTRGYAFDSEFLTPALLPPRTPMLRDVNNIGFTQDVSPTQ
jgi:type IV pilus assembly PilX-like protein